MGNLSILNTIKKMLGVDAAYDAFDTDIIVNINTAMMSLHQLGVGPIDFPFMISGTTETWEDFMGNDPSFEAVKTYIYLKVRVIFDPPANSFVMDAMQKQIEELEWRLNVQSQR